MGKNSFFQRNITSCECSYFGASVLHFGVGGAGGGGGSGSDSDSSVVVREER